MSKTKITFFALIVLSLVLTACSGNSAPAEEAPKIPAAMKRAYIESAKIYETLVPQETLLSADYQVWQESHSNMLAGAGEQLYVVNSCYSNSEQVIVQAANGVFGKDASGNPVSAEQENQAFINALAAGGSLYAGDITECQTAGSDLMEYLRVNRAANLGLRVKVIDEFRVYNLSQVENLKIATVMHFFNQYGPSIAELIANGEGYLLDQIAAEAGVEPLPLGFIGFPTTALKVTSKSEEICMGYISIYNGETPPPGGHNKLLFQAEWDPIIGSCTLYRRAAYNYMNNLFVTQQFSQQNDCGIDAGAFGTVDEDCNVIEE